MSKLIKKVQKFVAAKEEGASLVEYGMLVGLIAVACIVAVTALGVTVNGAFEAIETALDGKMVSGS